MVLYGLVTNGSDQSVFPRSERRVTWVCAKERGFAGEKNIYIYICIYKDQLTSTIRKHSSRPGPDMLPSFLLNRLLGDNIACREEHCRCHRLREDGPLRQRPVVPACGNVSRHCSHKVCCVFNSLEAHLLIATYR